MISIDEFCRNMTISGLANTYAASYGGPLYLVGSALTCPDPFDFDLRVVIGEADMLRLFGANERTPENPWSERQMRMAYDRLKQSRRLSRIYGGLAFIDFQVQSEASQEGYSDKPRRRLDTIPNWVWRAGLSDA